MIAVFRLHHAAAVCALAVAASASATSQRTFVASSGSDAHPCSIAQPCRSFAAAIAKTNAGGEVIVLDSAGYGPVTITQAVSIIAPDGIYAGISVFSGAGITVNVAGAIVRLVGLTVNQQGSGTIGINVVTADELAIERTWVSGFRFDTGDAGVLIGPYPSHVLIRDSFVADNYAGVLISAGANVPEVAIDHTTFQNNDAAAIVVNTPARVSVHGSHFSAHKEAFDVGFPRGIDVSPDASASNVGPVEVHVADSVFEHLVRAFRVGKGFASYASVSIVRSEIAHSNLGLLVTEGASAALEDARFVHDDTAVWVDSGSDVFTAGNNYMAYCGTYIFGSGIYHAPGGFL